MGLIVVVAVLLAPLLTVLGLAVLTAGSSRVLNGVDYARVDDPQALHRWAGARLLIVAVGVAVLGVLAVYVPAHATVLGVALALWLLLGLGAVMAGTSRFVRLR
ncbi:MAG: hypothetical protein LW860_11960 [Xanthomonadaceae bacterium]|jgi:hypothetical protein|nr:hypothetical protein [Xanthomonadaceae bacterium]